MSRSEHEETNRWIGRHVSKRKRECYRRYAETFEDKRYRLLGSEFELECKKMGIWLLRGKGLVDIAARSMAVANAMKKRIDRFRRTGKL